VSRELASGEQSLSLRGRPPLSAEKFASGERRTIAVA